MEAYRVTGADLAEIYYNDTADSLLPGDVVSLRGGASQIGKSSVAYDRKVIGVVSTKPGQVLGQSDGVGAPVIVGLAGRVPVKVSSENGPIEPGDFLVPSSTPGVAMKATGPGQSIGQALTGFSGSGQGSVIMFIKNTYYPGENPSSIPLGIISNLSNLGGSSVNAIGIGSDSSLNKQAITIGSTGSGNSLLLQNAGYSVNINSHGLGLGGSTVEATADVSFGSGKDRTMNVLQSTTGAGNSLTITAGQGAGTGDNGGNLILQAGAAGGSNGSAGSVIVKSNASDSGVNPAFLIQNSGGINLFAADTLNKLIRIGDGVPTLASSGLGDLLISGNLEVHRALRIGNGVDGLSFIAGVAPNSAAGFYVGSSRPVKTISQAPEYTGLTSIGVGNGSLTPGFDTSPGAFHSYYEWTTAQPTAQTARMFVRIAVPRDFSSFSNGDRICYSVWSDDTADTSVTATFYDTTSAAQAGFNATPSSASTWQQKCTTNIGGTVTVNGSSYATVEIDLMAGPNKHIRVGEFSFDYLSAF